MIFFLVIKDHFSKFTWLRAIQRKTEYFVATELRRLFHEIGFPSIFHSDNGAELINKTVFDLLKRNDPKTVFVSGAPRTPRHQGSVENQNGHVQTIMGKEVDILKKHYPITDPGWTDVLGPTTSALNNSCCYGNHNITPYRLVYTQDYDLHHLIPAKDRFAIRTVSALDSYINDEDLRNQLISVGYLDQLTSNMNTPHVGTKESILHENSNTSSNHDEDKSEESDSLSTQKDVNTDVVTENVIDNSISVSICMDSL